jgi:hypothetical protein
MKNIKIVYTEFPTNLKAVKSIAFDNTILINILFPRKKASILSYYSFSKNR